jgi:5,10-methylenetetrahydromethanopterin reductase
MTYGVGLMGAFEPDRFRRIVRLAERLGYGQVWIADEALYRNVYALLAIAAASTSAVHLGTAVTNPYTRHPALTAAAIATVDELSGGRAVLGLGAGGSAITVLGIERIAPLDVVRDAIEIINALTATGEANYKGERLNFSGALNFRPVRRVPIVIGSRGKRMLELAGELADGAILGALSSPEAVRRALEHVARGASRAGRNLAPFEVISWLYTAIAPSKEEAMDAVRRIVAVSIINSRSSLNSLSVTIPETVLAVLNRHGWKRTPEAITAMQGVLTEELLEAFSVTGTAAQCAERIAGLRAAGVTQVAPLFLVPKSSTLEEQMEQFAAAVDIRGG